MNRHDVKAKKVKNADLWVVLDRLMRTHRCTFKWVRGHVGHAKNERCDLLGTDAAREVARALPPVSQRHTDSLFPDA